VNRKQRRAHDKIQPARSSPRELFAAAVQRHMEGRLEDAAHLYQQVLAADPDHADSLHRLGVIAHQNGQHVLAADLLHQAISHATQVASYHSHMGLVLNALGRTEEAVVSCRTALALDPDLPDLHNNLGVLLLRLGRHEKPSPAIARRSRWRRAWSKPTTIWAMFCWSWASFRKRKNATAT
jgi:Flp pilus assembly protein TadD